MPRSNINTRSFFDRPAVTGAVDRAAVRVLSRFGAFVRQTARRSIRKPKQMKLSDMSPEQRESFRIRKEIAARRGETPPKRPAAPSRPGKPPRSQTGLLRKFIFFSFDRATSSVVVGPQDVPTAGPADVPRILEEGGMTKITTGPNEGQRRRVAARPYMGPAFAAEQPKLSGMWKDAVKR